MPDALEPDASRLTADCSQCFALCCVALAFSRSTDFAIDKRAGQPCPNLLADFRCGVHTGLRDHGFRGCTVYDCFGAGQQVAQVTYGGRDWRRAPATGPEMFSVFPVMRDLHELLWYLTQALTLPAGAALHLELERALAQTERSTRSGPAELLRLDVAAVRDRINPLLAQVSAIARAGVRTPPDHRGADLLGARLVGADLRGADLRGANLTGALFVTQSQLEAARGDVTTKLPGSRTPPAHW